MTAIIRSNRALPGFVAITACGLLSVWLLGNEASPADKPADKTITMLLQQRRDLLQQLAEL